MDIQFSDAPSLEELMVAAELGQEDPVWWMEEVLGLTLYPHQAGLIERTHRMARHPDPEQRRNKAFWASCNSAAKTHSLAGYSIYHLYNNFGAKVLQTAPTASQLTQVLWAEMRKMLAAAKLPLGGDLLPSANELRMDAGSYMVGLNAQVYEAFQGRKSPRLLIIVDEAPGCKDPMFDAMEGNMATGEPMLIAAGNPTRATGRMHRAFHSGRDGVHTEQVDAFDLPNLRPIKDEFDHPKTTRARKLQLLRTAPVVAEHLATGTWAAGILAESGEDSDVFRVRVRGLFPKGDPNQLITLGDVVDARARMRDLLYMTESMAALAASQGKPFPWWLYRHLLNDMVQGGLDVARFGHCNSVLASQWNFIWSPLLVWGPQSTTFLKGEVVNEVERLGINRLLVDEPGLGGGVVDDLPWMMSGVVPFNGGKAAFQPTRYANLRSQMFWSLRVLLQRGIPYFPDSQKLETQLVQILYSYLPKGERRVETKDEMAVRGIEEMDEADAVMMSAAQVPTVETARVGERRLESAPPPVSEDEEKW